MARRQFSGDAMGSQNSHQEGKGDDEESEKKLFIKNIPLAVDANGLRSLLGRWGKVVELRVVTDRNKPDVQFAFVTTETRADAVQILDQLDGYRIENAVLRVVYQKSRSRQEEEKGKAGSHNSGNAGPLDTESVGRNHSAFENRNNPIGRSQRLTMAAPDQERMVGMSRSGAAPTNGFGGKGLLDVAKQSSEQYPKQPLVSPAASSGSLSPGFACSVSSGSRKAPRTGPCAKCGRNGDKFCIVCKLLYCSRECQREDWSRHKKICVENDVGVEKPEECISRNRSGELHCEQTRQKSQLEETLIPMKVPTEVICIVPPFSPSEFYIFLKSDQQKLVDMGIKLCEFYNVPDNQRRPKSLPKVRDICVCQFSADNSWYRAEVEAVAGQKITVRYVDYGNKEDTSVASMCEIADQFKSTPYLTVRCRLADVEPLGPDASGDAWSEKAIRYIQEAVPQCVVLTMTAVCIRDDVCHVKLILPDGTNVAEKLIDAGLARRPPQQAAPASSQVQTSRSPDEKQRAEVRQRFADYGWPSDPNHLIGRRMTAEIVDCDPRGELWIRFDPLPGHTAPPRMRVLASESCLFAERHRGHVNGSLAEAEAAKPDPKARRCLVQDLPELDLQDVVKVEVTFVQDAGTFYCQDLLRMTKLVELQQNWTAPDPRSLSAYMPEEREICLGFYEKYGEWYRAEVLDQLDGDAFVFVIDYGEKMRLPLTSLLPLPKELSDFPPLAFHCQLSAWSMLKALSSDARKLFEEIVTGKPLTCEILSRDQTTGVRSVILSDLQSAQSVAIDLFAALERKAF